MRVMDDWDSHISVGVRVRILDMIISVPPEYRSGRYVGW